jgi:hypothetical protein
MLKTLAAALIAASMLTAPALAQGTTSAPQAPAAQSVKAPRANSLKAKAPRSMKKSDARKHIKKARHAGHKHAAHKRAHVAHRAPKSGVN